jgi:Probable cobalt transporter subunit (CbtB)
MTTASPTAFSKKLARFTLSVPMQATLYVSLCALVVWTIYFSTYPAVHNQMHSLRHHTLTVACH